MSDEIRHPKVVLLELLVSDKDLVSVEDVRLFWEHQHANKAAQDRFDSMCKDLEDGDAIFDMDDSDASHFTVSGDDCTTHLIIKEAAP